MVDIKEGLTQKPVISRILIDFFKSKEDFDGKLYIGYPILYSGENSIVIDALWISKKYGIIIFDLIEKEQDCNDYAKRQDLIYSQLDSLLRAYPDLKRGRKELLVNIELLSFASNLCKTDFDNYIVSSEEDLNKYLGQKVLNWDSSYLFDKVLSIIQSVVNLKKKTKRNIINPNSKGGILKNKLEPTIATLDRNQEEVVIKYFDGVQRIRGLAGSGKTIVLALKAAYYHSLFPDWNIAVTFNTRSLKDQFKDLITRFVVDKKREMPDWSKIRVVNAWGSPKDKEEEKGLYYDYCISNNIEYFDFRKAKSINKNNPFRVACKNALEKSPSHINEKFDAILIDEAQDLSVEFLQICYNFLKKPKRLIYAYDELQKLNEGEALPNPTKFLPIEENDYDDRILKICYRNSRPILVTAHALGFGIYREPTTRVDGLKTGLVQFFDQPRLWQDVGYEKEEGEFKAGERIVLTRTEESSPKYLEDHSPINDLLVFTQFRNKKEQAEWVANEIEKNLKEEELSYKDIIVINPIALTTKEEVALIRNTLLQKGINNHIAGEFNADIFFQDKSIAFTGINRAKGNEVPMVYIINAQDCYSSSLFNERDLRRLRNILFTAITRSKAWVRVVGIGNKMQSLINEFNKIKKNNFKLNFIYPSKEEIERINIIHRDITKEEERKLKRDVDTLNNLKDIVESIKNGKTFIEDYPVEVQKIIKLLIEKLD